jgi:hypothetical protein
MTDASLTVPSAPSAAPTILEAPGIFDAVLAFDGRIIEVFSRGASVARLHVAALRDLRWREQPDGHASVSLLGGHEPATVGFDAHQRSRARLLYAAIENARAAERS